ncbi:MAG: hypothetical protein HKN96_12640 [Flavobacteriaceae bacterium]|nr:hypothetical protein [Bacteroidia bacterium]NND12043.1 hypothetical protein [Flavobacteriaceae bacterium]NNK28067.1 hypothetical protein [Flavobacteriaceae bacterium]NNL61902.1 hypothetical protein [Flavobacteriaceae bacterium]
MDNSYILYIIIIAVLFAIVHVNNRKNKNKLYNRKGRNFRENYHAKKQERLKEKEADSK